MPLVKQRARQIGADFAAADDEDEHVAKPSLALRGVACGNLWAKSPIALGATTALSSSPSSSTKSLEATITSCVPRRTAGDSDPSRLLDLPHAFASVAMPHDGAERREFAEIEVLCVPWSFDQHVANQLRTDGRRTDRLHAQLPVHLPTRRIVDACDDPLDFEHALRDERSHDIAVVAVGDGDEAVGARGAGALQHVVIDARSRRLRVRRISHRAA